MALNVVWFMVQYWPALYANLIFGNSSMDYMCTKRFINTLLHHSKGRAWFKGGGAFAPLSLTCPPPQILWQIGLPPLKIFLHEALKGYPKTALSSSFTENFLQVRLKDARFLSFPFPFCMWSGKGMFNCMAAMKFYQTICYLFAYPVGKRTLESVDPLDQSRPDPLHQPASIQTAT